MVHFMENPIKMDDLGVPLFLETPIFFESRPSFATLRYVLTQMQVPLRCHLCWGDFEKEWEVLWSFWVSRLRVCSKRSYSKEKCWDISKGDQEFFCLRSYLESEHFFV